MVKNYEGIILKGIGGFYYVEAADGIFECKARGSFRKQGITPFAGDRVVISVQDNAENRIEEIKQRVSFMKRPPVANIDRLIVVASVCEPKPSTLVIDKLIAIAENHGIEPCIVITKTDLGDARELEDVYSGAGFETAVISSVSRDGIEKVREMLTGHISAFAGNSGVGKSTLLNCLDLSLCRQTGDISVKLGRGRHTTREVELFPFEGGYIADTPGFAALDGDNSEPVLKEELPFCFREFRPYLGYCKFSTCTHTVDKGCAVLEAVKNGDISLSRHASYVEMYKEVKDIKDWEL
ncbi:MAG: ribosome small subunit-dependent GTPase A [Clostridiales bacterium]|nr:ribosome small subunit-dependent GTPase A [Clostridiales bacterium]